MTRPAVDLHRITTPDEPTAKASLAAEAQTAWRLVVVGIVSCSQSVPFHRTIELSWAAKAVPSATMKMSDISV